MAGAGKKGEGEGGSGEGGRTADSREGFNKKGTKSILGGFHTHIHVFDKSIQYFDCISWKA